MIAIYIQYILLFAISLFYIIIIYYISNLLYSREKLQTHQKQIFSAYKDIIKNSNNPDYVSTKTKELLAHSREIIFAQILFLALIPIYLVFYYLLLPYIFSFITNPINFKEYFIFFVILSAILVSISSYIINKKLKNHSLGVKS